MWCPTQIGIFNVFLLPIAYGEGQERAFSRLRNAIQWSAERSSQEIKLRHRSRLAYQPLGDSDVRMLVLHAGEQSDDLEAHIKTSALSSTLGYQALSYCWGQESALHPLHLNESEPLFIRSNLFHALRRLRLSYESVRLWVDSVCIHQSDDMERNRQVARMGAIFKQARNVWI